MQVAVKERRFLNGAPNSISDAAALEKMWQELKVLTEATQDFRRSCRLHGIAVHNRRFLIVMPLYQGSLASRIRCAPGKNYNQGSLHVM